MLVYSEQLFIHMKKAVAYYRVSTNRQGESGLGLEAQQASVQYFAKGHGAEIRKEYTEIEKGRKANRPILRRALAYCRKHKALLVIAKLDRLGRNVAFISALMESKVEFVAVDNPYANRLVLHILAAFAEHEAKEIGDRTRKALQAAKRRGVQLGRNGHLLARTNKRKADEFAQTMAPIIQELQAQGFATFRALAGELNRRRIKPFRSKCRWHASTLHTLSKRIEAININ